MPEEMELLESYWPANTVESLLNTTLGDLLRQVVAEVPDRIALVEGSADRASRRRWTYLELLSAAEQTARALLSRFAPGERVAVCAPNCPEWLLLQHGLSLAGLILVPVNPSFKAREIETILRNAQVAGLFFVDAYRANNLTAAVAELRPALSSLRHAISLTDWAEFYRSSDPSLALPDVQPDHIIQIQYTSGTTGVPKGACLHHRGVINTSRFVAQRAGFPQGGVCVNAMPLFHIGGTVVTEIATIASRGTYVLQNGFDAGVLLELIESERGNTTLIVPTMILALLDHPDFAKRDLSSMKTIMTGAAVVPAALVHRTKSEFSCDLTILFGQTELNGVVCQTGLSDSVLDQAETLGKPLPHAEVKIADPMTGNIQPLDVAGEICVRGYQSMLGYYGLQHETGATLDEDGWLHTGDLGRMDKRGYVRFTGRLRDIIIRGGMNLYPREIEDILFDHPSVAQVSVLGLADERLGEIVAAAIIATDPQNPPSPDDLYIYCLPRLAAHKIPALWFFPREFPLTPSGKIQKFMLRQQIDDGTIRPIPWTRPKSSNSAIASLAAEPRADGYVMRT